MSRVCGGCKATIVEGRVLKAMEKDWHPDCFKCVGCKGPITGGSFAVKDGQPLCSKCAGQSLPGDDETCAICNKPLGGVSMEGLQGGHIHPECFVCGKCKKQVDATEGFVRMGDEPFHPACVEMGGKNIGSTVEAGCGQCGKELIGSCVTADGKSYHKACFVCHGCKGALAGGYMPINGQNYCEKCAKDARAKGPPQQPTRLDPEASNVARQELKKANVGTGQFAANYTTTAAPAKAAPPTAAPAKAAPAPAPAAAAGKPKFCGECGTKGTGGPFCGECGWKFV